MSHSGFHPVDSLWLLPFFWPRHSIWSCPKWYFGCIDQDPITQKLSAWTSWGRPFAPVHVYVFCHGFIVSWPRTKSKGSMFQNRCNREIRVFFKSVSPKKWFNLILMFIQMGNYCVSHVPLLLPILPPLYHISQVIPYIISRYPQIGKCLPSHWVAAHPNQLEPGWKSPHNKKTNQDPHGSLDWV